jgi:benzoylformate decarboxylase
MDPDYLRLERPCLDFVSLAKAFGAEAGEVVITPAAVKAALNRGIEHVLNNHTAYILDMRTADNTPPIKVISADGSTLQLAEVYRAQPALDLFHRNAGRTELRNEGASAGQEITEANIPSFF